MANFDFINVASMVRRVLASGQLSATTATTIYTVPATSEAKVGSFSLTNVTASVVPVTVAVVPSGGTLDATRTVLSAYPLAAGDTISHKDALSALDGLILEGGALISITAGTAAAVNYLLSGQVGA